MLKGLLHNNSSCIHIIGIAGVGMSGIAQILHKKGIKVQGSDSANNYYSDILKKLEIEVLNDQEADNIKKASLIVKSSAIKDDHPQIKLASQNSIPVIKRAEILRQITDDYFLITVAGAHGKTSTTGLLFTVLREAKIDPSVLNGGWINSISSNAYLGQSDYFVAEADESDGTFLEINSTIGIVTNVEPEHIDFYGSVERLEAAYLEYMRRSAANKLCVYCYDCPTARKLASKLEQQKKLISYGISPEADLQIMNIQESTEGVSFDLNLSEKCRNLFNKNIPRKINEIKINLIGNHNVLNATAVIATALSLKISIDLIQKGLMKYEGVRRRFSEIESFDSITFIDDYAHHPTEVIATLSIAKKLANNNNGKVVAIFQPHRFSRLKALWEEFTVAFKEADVVIITDVYSAGESSLIGIDSEHLAKEVANVKNTSLGSKVFYCGNLEKELPCAIQGIMNAGDYIVFMGAGDITYWASQISKNLKNLNLLK